MSFSPILRELYGRYPDLETDLITHCAHTHNMLYKPCIAENGESGRVYGIYMQGKVAE